MILGPRALRWSTRCYTVLLALYPVEFRVRFGREMSQVFRDCCWDETRKGSPAGLGALWFRALVDLAVSISRERGRVLFDARYLQVRTRGLIDSIVILTIIVFHLLAAGTGMALYLPRTYETPGGFFLVASVIGATLGGLGIICSLVLARFRRIHYRLITP